MSLRQMPVVEPNGVNRRHASLALVFRRLIAAAILACAPVSVVADDIQTRDAAILMDVRGAIGPATSEYVREGFRQASLRRAKLVLLRFDTPGGLDSSMREIIRDILDSPLPVIAYVSPSGARAASAGTYILYATHLAAMAPSTHLGAATPVQLGIGFRPTDKERERGGSPTSPTEAKAINDAVAYIKGLAELRGRNAEWAEKAVREAATLTATEAHSQRVVEIIASDTSDLLRQAHSRSVRIGDREVKLETEGLTVVELEPDWRNRFLAAITNPNIAYILMLVGVYGLFFEFISPGAIVPGVIGAITLLIALYALNLLPINYAGAGLLLLGVALMVAEAFLPAFGVVGIGGIAAFAFGSLFLFRSVPGFQISWQVVATATAAGVGFLAFALAAAWQAHRRGAVTGEEALLGSTGRVLSWADGAGEIQVMGERWRAKSTAELVPHQRVRIIRRRDLTLQVEPEIEATPKP